MLLALSRLKEFNQNVLGGEALEVERSGNKSTIVLSKLK